MKAFAHVDYDGTVLERSHVVGVTRLGGAVMPKTYVIELDHDVVPDRTHISVSSRATVTTPPERVNTGVVGPRHVGVTFLGLTAQVEDIDMRFTVTVESF